MPRLEEVLIVADDLDVLAGSPERDSDGTASPREQRITRGDVVGGAIAMIAPGSRLLAVDLDCEAALGSIVTFNLLDGAKPVLTYDVTLEIVPGSFGQTVVPRTPSVRWTVREALSLRISCGYSERGYRSRLFGVALRYWSPS